MNISIIKIVFLLKKTFQKWYTNYTFHKQDIEKRYKQFIASSSLYRAHRPRKSSYIITRQRTPIYLQSWKSKTTAAQSLIFVKRFIFYSFALRAPDLKSACEENFADRRTDAKPPMCSTANRFRGKCEIYSESWGSSCFLYISAGRRSNLRLRCAWKYSRSRADNKKRTLNLHIYIYRGERMDDVRNALWSSQTAVGKMKKRMAIEKEREKDWKNRQRNKRWEREYRDALSLSSRWVMKFPQEE